MNCKPGDLAIIVRSRLAPENIGRIVEVVRRRAALTERTGEPQWLVRCDRSLVERWPNGHVRHVTERFYLDACLRPVTGMSCKDDALDRELPVAVNLPEAFKLALGVERRDWVGA